MVCEQNRSEIVDFVCSYRVEIECEKECKIILNGEEMEEANEFKDLGSVMCKHGGTEGETRERALQRRKVVGSLGQIYHEWQRCEHGGKEGYEKHSKSTNPHICERNLGLE